MEKNEKKPRMGYCDICENVYKERLKHAEYFDRRIEIMHYEIERLAHILNRLRSELRSASREYHDNLECIVRSSGLQLDQSQEDAVYLILRRMVTKSIDSHDGNRILHTLELIEDDDYNPDITSPLVDELKRALRSYPATDGRIKHDLKFDPEQVVHDIRHMFNDEVAARDFVLGIANAKPTDITAKVSKLGTMNIIDPKYCYKDLWEVLHKHGIYPRQKNTWNSQIDIKKK